MRGSSTAILIAGLLAVGCDDAGDSTGGTTYTEGGAGLSGASGKGGSAGKGGSSGKGSTNGGASGSAAGAGTGGAAGGGSAGAGASGAGGTGGAGAGSSGASGAGGAGAGAGGVGGAGGNGGAVSGSSGHGGAGAGGAGAGGSGAGGGGGMGGAPVPVTALVELIEENLLQTTSLVANNGYANLYTSSVNVLPGDTLRIRAQGEMTNNYQDPVSGSIRIVSAGNQVGTWMAQNAIADQSHHMPLWADAIVVADAAGALEIGAQWAASRGDASPEVTMESGYGHLVVEHYRAFPSVEAAAQAGALLLADTFSTSVALAGFYDGSASAITPAEVYSASVAVEAGDRLHLLAQVSTSYTSSIEMQGQQIRADGAQISPWSTSNHSASMPDLPLWTDAIDAPLTAGNRVYSAAVHGVAGVGGAILGGYGSLQGLRFSTAQAGALSYLGGTVDAMSAPTQVIANAPAQDLLARSVSVSAGDRLRVTGVAQITHPPGFPGGISCATRVVLQDGAGNEVASGMASKYVTPLLEALPLRGELVVPVASAGAWVARLTLACSRQDDSPAVPVVGAWLLVEQFGH